ncbi:MAG: Ig-like domain-containing protein [Acidobacteriota bacterium]
MIYQNVWKHRVVELCVVILALSGARAVTASSVTSVPPLPAPSGTVVNVATVAQLQNAVSGAAPNTTIVIAPGTYRLTAILYVVDKPNLVIRGATNNRDDVVLVGKGMSDSSLLFGIWSNSPRLTIANLTIRDVYDHPIILNAGSSSVRIYNTHLINAGQQFIKSNPDGSGGGNDDGIVEYSVLEYTSTSRDAYTNGVDVHTGKNWIIRNNLFQNIAAPQGMLAGPAVLMWNGSSNATVEGNTFINCQREISMGLIQRSPNDHSGGVVRNNFIYRRSGIAGDAAILVASSPNTQVVHNTIVLNGTYPNAVEYRFAESRNVVVASNLASGQIQARDGATGTASSNYTSATAAMFVGPAAGDLHLLASATAAIDKVAVRANATTDWDGNSRPQGAAADYGADEYGGGSTPPPPPPSNQLPSVSLTAPANGTTYTAPASIAFTATASDPDGSVAKVEFYNGTTLVGTDNTSTYSATWTGVPAGTYVLTAVAYDNLGATAKSATATVTVSGSSTPPALPAPWSTSDIGAPAVAGSASHSNGTFTVKAGGVDIWDASDQFRFVYQPLNGNGEITARVTGLTNTDAWAKAGVMVREDLTAGARNAMALVTPGSGLSFQRRVTAGGSNVSNWGISGAAPQWVRLVRAGSTFTAYRSTNGSTWTVMGTATIAMKATVYVGLAATSHNASAATTVTLTNVSVTPRP